MSYSETIAKITATDPKADKIVRKQSVIISDYFMRKCVIYYTLRSMVFTLKEIKNKAG